MYFQAIPINALMVCIAVIQAILAIMTSAFACHGLCGGRKTNHNVRYFKHDIVTLIPIVLRLK